MLIAQNQVPPDTELKLRRSVVFTYRNLAVDLVIAL